MQVLQTALAALEFARSRFHDLVDPAAQIAKAVEDVAVAAANEVRALKARIDSLEQQLIAVSNAPAIQSDVGITPAPASDESATPGGAPADLTPAAGSEVVEPIVPVAIPLSAELQAAIDVEAKP